MVTKEAAVAITATATILLIKIIFVIKMRWKEGAERASDQVKIGIFNYLAVIRMENVVLDK